MDDKKSDPKNYWAIRREIEKASEDKDDNKLKAMSTEYPEIFNNVLRFVKNQMRRKR